MALSVNNNDKDGEHGKNLPLEEKYRKYNELDQHFLQ